MHTADLGTVLGQLFSELADGVSGRGGFILNGGDAGLIASLDRLSAGDASRSVHDGATVAAHTRHLRYGLSLMNRWARDGGHPFAGADWGEAWKTTSVDETAWERIRRDLKEEVGEWQKALTEPREVEPIELTGMIASVAHLAYHLGAIRQIQKAARGPKEAGA